MSADDTVADLAQQAHDSAAQARMGTGIALTLLVQSMLETMLREQCAGIGSFAIGNAVRRMLDAQGEHSDALRAMVVGIVGGGPK